MERLLEAGCAGGTGEAAAAESQMYAEFLRIVLEIINCALAAGKGPASNPQLVYSLLHRQEVFASFRHEAQFQELLANVFLVLDFFNARVSSSCCCPPSTASSRSRRRCV